MVCSMSGNGLDEFSVAVGFVAAKVELCATVWIQIQILITLILSVDDPLCVIQTMNLLFTSFNIDH
jgi:hypothetical protein